MISTAMTMLLWSSALMFALILVPAGAAILRNGPELQAGSRDNLPEPSVFMKRANRLNQNMRENMIIFAILVIMAEMLKLDHPNVSLGATLFFYGRLVHAVIYLAGWPWIRPVAWFASVVGMGMIAVPLLQISFGS